MISNMRDDEDGSRIGIVMNGSSIFKGRAASSESEIRRWIFENDWVEAIVALPEELFYNTGLQTYVWLLTNRKPENRRNKVQLIDASGQRFWRLLRKSLGEKRREIPEAAREDITRIYAKVLNGGSETEDVSKIFNTDDFGFREIRVERPLRLNFKVCPERLERLSSLPQFSKLTEGEQGGIINVIKSLGTEVFLNRDVFAMNLDEALKAGGIRVGTSVRKAILAALAERDENADICIDVSGHAEPDPDLRDHEQIGLNQNIDEYFDIEIHPFSPDSWIDRTFVDAKDKKVGRVGYEIPFNRHFYSFERPPTVAELDKSLGELRDTVAALLREVA
jgi:type I restriction enzyme M protein